MAALGEIDDRPRNSAIAGVRDRLVESRAVGMLERASISFASSPALTASGIDAGCCELVHEHVRRRLRLRSRFDERREERVPAARDQLERRLVAEHRLEPRDPRARQLR